VKRDTPAVTAALLLFFVSGAAALVYQVAWQRLLALHSGVGLYSVAMIVAAFMAGLGLGSHLGGVASTRLSRLACLRAFAALEILVSAFGAASTWIYYDWLYPLAVHLPSPSWRGGLLHFLALLPPTVLMGMSLPFLARAVVTDVAGAGRRIGWLYGVNVLGASLGALATPWLLLPWGGIPGAVHAAAAANLLVGVLALLLSSLRPVEEGAPSSATPTEPAFEPPGRRPLGLWLALYGLSGFVALSLEIVWFRILDVAVKSTAFTFGSVLSVYLLGSAAGSLAVAPRVARLRHPLRAFLLVQCALVALASLAVVGLVDLPASSPPLAGYVDYWSAYDFFSFGHEHDLAHVVRLYVILPGVLFLVPTILMGASFPILQRAVQDDPATSGRKVGVLQAANIAGCTAGSLLVGLVAMGTLGTAGSLRLLTAGALVFAAVGLRYYGRAFAAPALALALLSVVLPGREALWRRLHGVGGDALALFEEDATGVVALTPDSGGFRLSVNGKGNSWVPYGSRRYGSAHTVLGAIPATVHPRPTDVGVIGLGSGNTVWAAAFRPETRKVTVFEISSPQPRALWRLVGLTALPEVRHLLEDPRLVVRIEDGRKALEASDATYDVLETDATWPETAGSGNLYSVEFFEAARRRLRPGGVMCTWAPTPRVRATFQAVFPHVVETEDGEVLVGSALPIPFEPAVWASRIAASEGYLGRAGGEEVLAALAGLRPAAPPAAGSLNRDLFPRDEYAVP
jgi:spermidine synthase